MLLLPVYEMVYKDEDEYEDEYADAKDENEEQ